MIGFSWFKVIGIILLVVSFIGFTTTVKYQFNKIQDLNVDLKLEKKKTNELSLTIEHQNKSIIESNAKYEEVQKQLDKANEFNKEIRSEFRKFRSILNKKPIPQTCEAANVEMIEIGKELGKKWSK